MAPYLVQSQWHPESIRHFKTHSYGCWSHPFPASREPACAAPLHAKAFTMGTVGDFIRQQPTAVNDRAGFAPACRMPRRCRKATSSPFSQWSLPSEILERLTSHNFVLVALRQLPECRTGQLLNSNQIPNVCLWLKIAVHRAPRLRPESGDKRNFQLFTTALPPGADVPAHPV